MASSLVNNKYKITRRIGGGSFGEIYMGVGPNNEKLAVKFERHGTRCPQLRHEYKVYRELANCFGFCKVYEFGTHDNYNVMVMDLLGPSLEDLFNKCNRRFSLKTVLQIADQMLERVDTMHSRHLIHRDIKPANFVIGLGDTAATIFCVDFGLSKRYRHPKNLQHIPHRDGRSLTGTPRYASINNHLGIEQSRRDDLESIGYVLIYFLKGSLPWQGLKAKNAQKKYRLILEKKQQVSIAQLCQGCPSQFAEFLAYTRSLKFDAKPDIPYLRKLFRDLYHAQNCSAIPKLWDWDGMENDFGSVGGSAGGVPSGVPAVVPAMIPSSQPGMGLRPTTAAAVGGLETDLMLNGPGEKDDLDDDFEMRNHDRPNTASGMLPGYGRSGVAAGPPSNPATWGYSRQESNAMGGAPGILKVNSSAGNEYGGDVGPNARRPHTAHGARAGYPSQQPTSLTGYGNTMNDGNKAAIMQGEAEDGNVMRRNVTNPAVVGSAAVSSQSNSWAVYQNGGKAAAPVQATVNAARKSGVASASSGNGSSNWPTFGDRPKSANVLAQSATGMNSAVPSNNRPTSSTPAVSASAATGQWNATPSTTNLTTNATANSLSYGSLKNRFLSGTTTSKPSGAVNSGVAVNNASNTTSANPSSSKSKLFSLAR